MAISRRQFCKLSCASIVLANAPKVFAEKQTHSILSCRTNEAGEHFFTVISSKGELLSNTLLPSRGHGITIDSTQNNAAIFARRPGDYVWISDLSNYRITHKINATHGRHFYGHGEFSADGSKLFCSENAYETGEGVIGIYDVGNNYSRLGEIPSHGIGPHEIKLLNHSNTLVVANGGIQTHPDTPRIKLNLSDMRPNLAYVDSTNGQLLHKHEPEADQHQLSIRHIDVSANNDVAIAMQYEGQPHHLPPLIAIQRDNQAMQMLIPPSDIQRRLRNYCGSVAFSANSETFAVSSPRGGLVTYWSVQGNFLGAHNQIDACGIFSVPFSEDEFFISSGNGDVIQTDINHEINTHHTFKNSSWDNHMTTFMS